MMPIKTDYTPSLLLCPKCGHLIRLVKIEPSVSVLGGDDITYQCGFCNHEERRIRTADKA